MRRIPLIDLQAQHQAVSGEVESSVLDILKRAAFIGGDVVAEFESNFAAFCGSTHAIGVASGTDALRLAMQAVGVGPGTNVVTVSHTFVATAEAAAQLGADVRFVDVEPRTALLDPTLLADAIDERTVAVVPVHLYGRCVDMDPILEIAHNSGCAVIEDAAQAHGATYKGRVAGSMGDIGCFSFYPSKNLGAAGDGGAVVTDSGELAEKVRNLGSHGGATKYLHEIVGWNSRLDAVQAAVLIPKLRRLASWNEQRRNHARRYDERLRGMSGVSLPSQNSFGDSVFHLYVVRVNNRSRVQAELESRGIATGVHYPVPLHKQHAYRMWAGRAGSLTNSELWADTVMSLPMYPEMSSSDVELVCDHLVEIAARNLANVR